MPKRLRPIIDPADYAALKQLLNDDALPQTHEEWLAEQRVRDAGFLAAG